MVARLPRASVRGETIAVEVVDVGGLVAQGVGHLLEITYCVVGVVGGVAAPIGAAEAPVEGIVGGGLGVAQRVGLADHQVLLVKDPLGGAAEAVGGGELVVVGVIGVGNHPARASVMLSRLSLAS
jgi:hypothetical protein